MAMMTTEIPLPYPRFWQYMFTPRRAAVLLEARVSQTERAIAQMQLRRHTKDAKDNIKRLEHLLEPERRGEWSESLAHWQAHIDSLESDGVRAIPKGLE
jgi:hypothetical protein